MLDARGIEGLISFGSPNLHEEFPSELDHYAVVTVGLGIKGRIHRVTSNFFGDTVATFERLSGLGYRNPGLVIDNYEVMHRDFGIPATPHIEMVESCWIDGVSLRCVEAGGRGMTRSC